MRGYVSVTCGTALACLLAFLAGTADGAAQPKRAAFRVTLEATVTKDWNTVTESTEENCTVFRRSIGRRTVTLRSARPTTVLVTFGNGRVSYSPAAVRYVTPGSPERDPDDESPGPLHGAHDACHVPTRLRTLRGARFGFFRSARNELSFHPARLPELSAACSADRLECERSGRASRSAGRALGSSAGQSAHSNQTAFASAEVETELEGQATAVYRARELGADVHA